MRAFLVAAALAAFSSSATAQDYEVPVTPGWGNLTYSAGGSVNAIALEATMTVMEIDGRVAVCGVVMYGSPNHAEHARDLMRATYVTMDGRRILNRIDYFPIIRRGSDPVGQMARCRLSDAAYQPGANFDTGLSRHRF